MITYGNWNVDERFIKENVNKLAWLDDSYLAMAEIGREESYYQFLVEIRNLKNEMYQGGWDGEVCGME